MVNVTYSYYKDEYFGDLIQEEEFKKLIKRAKPYLSVRTFGRVDNIDESSDENIVNKIKDTYCSVAEILKAHTGDDGIEFGVVTSESVGGSWSRSFSVDEKAKNIASIINDKICLHLANTGLLYAGDD